MFGWITSLIGSAAGDVTAGVKALINAAIRGLYGFLHGIFNAVSGGWSSFWNDVRGFYRAFGTFAHNVAVRFFHLLKVIIPAIYHRIAAVYAFLFKLIETGLRDLRTYVLKLYHVLDAFIRWLWKWVIKNVYDPLLAFIEKAWHWITHEGATVWHYFTHLADFAELLFWHLIVSLEKHAWDVAKYLGKFFLALIVRNVVQFATLIESIIVAVL